MYAALSVFILVLSSRRVWKSPLTRHPLGVSVAKLIDVKSAIPEQDR